MGTREYKFVTGIETATTPTATTPTEPNHVGTKAYIDSVVNAAVAAAIGSTTGDLKPTYKVAADLGWVMMNDGTIGNAASGGTSRANADTSPLFVLLWNNTTNANCAVSGGRGASAAADFAANKTIALPKMLGRAMAFNGAGAGLTARSLAQTLGTETFTLSTNELPSHTHVQNSHTHTVTTGGGGTGFIRLGETNNAAASSIVVPAATATNQNTGSGAAFSIMQPSTFVNVMIKL